MYETADKPDCQSIGPIKSVSFRRASSRTATVHGFCAYTAPGLHPTLPSPSTDICGSVPAQYTLVLHEDCSYWERCDHVMGQFLYTISSLNIDFIDRNPHKFYTTIATTTDSPIWNKLKDMHSGTWLSRLYSGCVR